MTLASFSAEFEPSPALGQMWISMHSQQKQRRRPGFMQYGWMLLTGAVLMLNSFSNIVQSAFNSSYRSLPTLGKAATAKQPYIQKGGRGFTHRTAEREGEHTTWKAGEYSIREMEQLSHEIAGR